MTDSQHEVEPPSDEDLLQRLDAIAKHDWRVSFLAHTSDTAAEAAARLRGLLSDINRREREHE